MHYREIRELSGLIESRSVSPVDITSLMLDRIERFDGELTSYSWVMREDALATAAQREKELASGRSRGPLHGVPLAVKDLFWTAGAPTAAGTTVMSDFYPDQDATAVARLRDAGAIILGKLRMSEAALAAHHPELPTPRNPWDADAWVGASSSGSAAATSAGLCFGALGTDTGGSIRFPSASTGLTGLKPTWGRVSRYGTVEFAGTLDHVGPMARSSYDCAIMMDAIAGADPADPTSLRDPVPRFVQSLEEPLPRLRIGIDPSFSTGFETSTLEMLSSAEQVFAGLGIALQTVTIPDVSELIGDWSDYCAVEAAVAHDDYFPSRRAEYGPQVAGFLDRGLALPATDFHRMNVRRREFAGRFQTLFDDVDVILLPVLGISSPTVAEMDQMGIGDRWRNLVMKATCPINFAGNPSLTLPGGFTEQGNPLGFQLVGARLAEPLLLRLGHAFQQRTDFHRQHPLAFA